MSTLINHAKPIFFIEGPTFIAAHHAVDFSTDEFKETKNTTLRASYRHDTQFQWSEFENLLTRMKQDRHHLKKCVERLTAQGWWVDQT